MEMTIGQILLVLDLELEMIAVIVSFDCCYCFPWSERMVWAVTIRLRLETSWTTREEA